MIDPQRNKPIPLAVGLQTHRHRCLFAVRVARFMIFTQCSIFGSYTYWQCMRER